MSVLIVVNNPENWRLEIPDTQVVSARAYLTQPEYSTLRGARVFNLCRSYRYQSLGYYVSLLAVARGHKPMPGIGTVQDLRSAATVRLVGEELDELIQSSLRTLVTDSFTISIYFGRNLAKRHDRLAARLFSLFPAPFLRAELVRGNGKWTLRTVRVVSTGEVPPEHHPFVVEAATEYFSRKRPIKLRRDITGYDMAILHNPEEAMPPSDDRALARFIRAAKARGMRAELITRSEMGLLPQYDALFIRETTSVNDHTYRFAQRAQAEGLVVIDDPESIIRCTNKVYLAELLAHHGVPTPKTMVVHRQNADQVAREIGLPCILKQPDSSFSQGVFKAMDEEGLCERIKSLLETSELIIAQEFISTPFDWRVGILDRRPLFVCQYYMAKNHWQIQRTDPVGRTHYGDVVALPLVGTPQKVIRTALRAANLIGDGLYGVDLKEHDGKVSVIEVNDNPSVEHGIEDKVLKDELYNAVMDVFRARLEQKKGLDRRR